MDKKQQDGPRARLIDVAGRVFAQKGYEAATVREICERAGVNVAAVGYYFRGKQRLYEQSLQCAADSLREELPGWAAGTTALEQFRAFVDRLVSVSSASGGSSWRLRLLLREALAPTGSYAGLAREAMRPLFEMLANLLDELLPWEVSRTKIPFLACSILSQCLPHALAEIAVASGAPGNELLSDSAVLTEHLVEFYLSPPWGTAHSRPEGC